MITLVWAIHVAVCVVLIAVILIQRGRGGGFIEGFSGLESMFGTKTSAFLSRLTSVLAVTFFCTCLLLAFLSLRESKSLMRGVKPKAGSSKQVPVTNTTVPAGAGSETAAPVAAKQPLPSSVPANSTAP